MGMGIYAIQNVLNDKMYIGSTGSIERRKNEHVSKLKDGRHINKHLQSAFNKYGEHFFLFKVLEEVDLSERLIQREQYWIDLAQTEETVLYNKSLIAGKVQWTPEIIERMASKHRGMKASKETLEKLRTSHLGKIPVNKGTVKMICLRGHSKVNNIYKGGRCKTCAKTIWSKGGK